MTFEGFKPSFFKFLKDLKANNDKPWFEANKARYKAEIEAPLLDFITAIAPKLAKVSPHFMAIPKVNGGSMFRIHRDVRFSKDKTPYKTHAAAQFRHDAGKDAHAPGFYLHLEPGRVFYGGGLWMPPSDKLKAIRERIAGKTSEWSKAKGAASVKKTFGDLREGDPLSRPPKGFDPDHPAIDDLKKRSFFIMAEAPQKAAATPGFVDDVAKAFKDASPVMKFLCQAVGAPY